MNAQQMEAAIIDLQSRVRALEAARNPAQQLGRIATALNQFGELAASLAQNQTQVANPATPWRPV